jgi:tetratricopeptide (TPR) repeat protein
MDCTRIAEDQVMERYLLGQLDDAELEAFELHFFECEECFSQLEALQAAQQVLTAEPVSRALQIEHPKWIRTWGWAVAAAAVVVIGLVAALWWVMRPPLYRTASLSPALAELARIEAPYYEPVRLRGVQDDAQQRFRTAMEFYSTGDYVSAIPGLEEAATLDPNAPNISFFLGACYLLADRTSDGINTLQNTVALGDTVFLEEVHLLLAKAHVHHGEFDVARCQLEAVIDLDGDFAPQARGLLDELMQEVPKAK